jgi:hypothetical protein
MSNTLRWTQPGWDINDPVFQQYFPNIKSEKHQRKDRPSSKPKRRFCKGLRNSLYNLRRKLDEQREKESLDSAAKL